MYMHLNYYVYLASYLHKMWLLADTSTVSDECDIFDHDFVVRRVDLYVTRVPHLVVRNYRQ